MRLFLISFIPLFLCPLIIQHSEAAGSASCFTWNIFKQSSRKILLEPTLYEKLKAVVNGDGGIASIDATRLSDLKFLELLGKDQRKVFDLLVKNYVNNVKEEVKEVKKKGKGNKREKNKGKTTTGEDEEEEVKKGNKMGDAKKKGVKAEEAGTAEEEEEELKKRNVKRIEALEQNCPVSEVPLPSSSHHLISEHDVPVGHVGSEGKVTSEIVEEIEEEEEEKNIEAEIQESVEPVAKVLASLLVNAEALDKERWNNEKKKSFLKWATGKAKSLFTGDPVKSTNRGIRWEVEEEARKEKKKERTTGFKEFRRNWEKNKWLAIPKLFLYYLNPMHCVGLKKVVHNVSLFWNEAKKKEHKEKKTEEEYLHKGNELFQIFCYLHSIPPDSVETPQLDVSKPAELANLIGVLKQFTLSALLIPFQTEKDPYDGEHYVKAMPGLMFTRESTLDPLGMVKAVLTEKKVFEALVADEMRKREASKDEEGGANRRKKRAVVGAALPTMTFTGVSFAPSTIGVSLAVALGIMVAVAIPFWCN